MRPDVRLVPASAFSLEVLADLNTRTFADYFYEVLVTPEEMSQFVRAEQLDLDRSPVLCVGDDLTGLALVGLRGSQAYCKGFGITAPFRGRGLAHALCLEMLNQARQAGARCLGLGVLRRNEAAVRTYRRAGLRVWRELLSFEWASSDGPFPCRHESRRDGRSSIQPIEPAQALKHFDVLHTVAPTWHRDQPTLRVLPDLKGIALWDGPEPHAYILYQETGAGAVEIQDVASTGAQQAGPLLATLQGAYAHIACSNEPAESPALAAFRGAGFRETWPRYEMTITLSEESRC